MSPVHYGGGRGTVSPARSAPSPSPVRGFTTPPSASAPSTPTSEQWSPGFPKTKPPAFITVSPITILSYKDLSLSRCGILVILAEI